jgi:hypothetical protein
MAYGLPILLIFIPNSLVISEKAWYHYNNNAAALPRAEVTHTRTA